MRKLVLIFGLFVTLNTNVWAEEIKDELYPRYTEQSDEIISTVQKFKDVLKTDNQQLIAQNVVYPFNLGDDCPPIQDENEFMQKYNIVFSPILLSQVISSRDYLWHLDEKQEGIFYDSPYIQLSMEGKLVDIEPTSKRQRYNNECIQKEKNNIHRSIRKYEKKSYVLETSEFIYRIDLIDKGGEYRLAIWNKGQRMFENPLKILYKGKLELCGSANNEKYIFTDKKTSYIIQINTARALETIPIEITVINNILSKKYQATNITNNPNLY